MGATLKQTLVVRDSDGREIVITDSDTIVQQDARVELICDSPRHESRFGNKDPLVWDEKAAQKDITSLPDGFFHLIKLMPDPLNEQHQLVFCGAQCVKDYLTYTYVPPKTAKERLAESRPELDKNPAQMELPFLEEAAQ